MMKIRSFFINVVLAALLLTVSSVSAAVRMPAFSLTSVLDGKEVNSGSFAGKALLVTFFATWCPPCRMEVPELIRLQEKFSAEGFSVIGLSVDQGGAAGVAAFAKKELINYPVLMADYQTSSDFGGVLGIPTAFLVNREGEVVKRYQGFVGYDTLEQDVVGVVQ